MLNACLYKVRFIESCFGYTMNYEEQVKSTSGMGKLYGAFRNERFVVKDMRIARS